jgi:medium-chain acyl-[acyl-carrier-protein] hydrolase
MPRYRENITITTWANAVGGLKTIRSFEISDEKGNVLVKAVTLWILVNLESRRPQRLDVLDLIAGERDPIIDSDFSKIKDIEKNVCMKFDTFFQQSDYNGHINNSIYLWWAIETLGSNFFKGKVMSDLKIQYINELKLGESVTSYMEIDGTKTYHVIINNETGKDCAKLEIEWKNI